MYRIDFTDDILPGQYIAKIILTRSHPKKEKFELNLLEGDDSV